MLPGIPSVVVVVGSVRKVQLLVMGSVRKAYLVVMGSVRTAYWLVVGSVRKGYLLHLHEDAIPKYLIFRLHGLLLLGNSSKS